jgi:hypothetical protein
MKRFVLFTAPVYGVGPTRYVGESDTLRGAKLIRSRIWNKDGFVNIDCADTAAEGDGFYRLVDLTSNRYAKFVIRCGGVPRKKGAEA